MADLIVLVLEVLVVAGVVFAAAAVAFGRGEVMAPAPRDAAPPELPADRPLTGADVREVRFELAFRGYRMADVDAVLDRLAVELGERDRELAERDRELATLRSARFGEPPTGEPPTGEPATGEPPTGEPPTGEPATGGPRG